MRARGFTLIEMLVALALVALMSVAMIEAYRFGQRSLAQTTQVDGAVHDVAATQRLLRRVLEAAYPFELPANTPAREAPHGLVGAASGFSVSAPAPARAGGVGLYRYTLSLSAEGVLGMSWMTDRNGAPVKDATGEVPSEALLKGVESNDQGAVSYSSESIVVNPLNYVFSVITTPETGGHVCQFHHPSV